MDGGREDAVIGSAEVWEERGRSGEAFAAGGEGPRFAVEGDGWVDADVQFSSGVEGDTGTHGICGRELIAEFTVNFAGVRPSRGVFGFEAVEFLEDFDGNPDVVVLEMKHGEGVVDQDVRIEDEIFDSGGSSHGLVEFAHGVGVNARQKLARFLARCRRKG